MLDRETWARHFMSSVGVEIRQVARPPVAPAVKILRYEVDWSVGDERRESVRLYVTKRRALRAP